MFMTGMGHTEDQMRPQAVDALRGNKVESIACGAAHTAAVVGTCVRVCMCVGVVCVTYACVYGVCLCREHIA